MSAPADNVYRHPNGVWWAKHPRKENTEFSLHTRNEKLARARYAGFYAHFEAWRESIDPADAGMDNPPAPEVEVLDRRLILAWKTIGELQRRVEELIKLWADEKDRVEELEARERVLREALEQIERKNIFLGDANMELLDRSKASEIRAEAAEARERVLTSLANFFASVIRSGEPWTETCQTAYDEALEGGTNERKQEVTDA